MASEAESNENNTQKIIELQAISLKEPATSAHTNQTIAVVENSDSGFLCFLLLRFFTQ